MSKVAAFVAISTLLVLADVVQASGADVGPEPGLVEYSVKTKLKDYEQLEMFLLPPKGGKAKGVMCLCLLAKDAEDVRSQLLGKTNRQTVNCALDYAAGRGFAVVAWGARQMWDPSRNWDEVPRQQARKFDFEFGRVASAWDVGIKYFIKNHGLPESGYLMMGSSAAAQFAQRLALRCPERFLAVHVHIASSFDIPVKKASTLFWCVSTGENEMGYRRSMRFFQAARRMSYPIVYKAYPGLGHDGSAKVRALGFLCFDYVLAEYARATKLNGGKPAMPNWAKIFSEAPLVADVFNQAVYPKQDESCVPEEFRMRLPERLRDTWSDE